MKTLIDTSRETRVRAVQPGMAFQLSRHGGLTHIKLADDSPHFVRNPGKAYSVADGRIVEHDRNRVCYIIRIKQIDN
jgi:hypothetical protein